MRGLRGSGERGKRASMGSREYRAGANWEGPQGWCAAVSNRVSWEGEGGAATCQGTLGEEGGRKEGTAADSFGEEHSLGRCARGEVRGGVEGSTGRQGSRHSRQPVKTDSCPARCRACQLSGGRRFVPAQRAAASSARRRQLSAAASSAPLPVPAHLQLSSLQPPVLLL